MTIIKKKERASIKGGGGGEHFCKGKVKPAEKKNYCQTKRIMRLFKVELIIHQLQLGFSLKEASTDRFWFFNNWSRHDFLLETLSKESKKKKSLLK